MFLRADAAAVTKQIVPFTGEFFSAQRKKWIASGGELFSLPAADESAMIAKVSSIGNDLSQSNPELNQATNLWGAD